MIHLGIGLSTVGLAIFFLLFLYSSESCIKKVIESNKIIGWCIRTLSRITLAVYLVQGFADRMLVKQFLNMRFPFSYVLEMIVVLTIAYIVTSLDDYVHKMIRKKSR